jgi:hypothetical protein
MPSLSSCSRAWSLLSITTTLLALLYLPTTTRAEFNEEDCLRCVGVGYISDNLSNSTYCAVVDDDDTDNDADEPTYQCLPEGDVVSCTDGSSFYVGEECIDEKELAVAVTILILLLCCCCSTAMITGGIAVGLVYCCCVSARHRATSNDGALSTGTIGFSVPVVDEDDATTNHNNNIRTRHGRMTSLEMTTITTTTPTYAALPTAMEESPHHHHQQQQQQQHSSSFPFAEAFSLNDDHGTTRTAKLC